MDSGAVIEPEASKVRSGSAVRLTVQFLKEETTWNIQTLLEEWYEN